MTFRVALVTAALITVSGAAHAQTFQTQAVVAQPAVERVVVRIDGKSMPALRSELAQAAEAVCRSERTVLDGPDVTCVDATYASALRQARLARAAAGRAPALTEVASR